MHEVPLTINLDKHKLSIIWMLTVWWYLVFILKATLAWVNQSINYLYVSLHWVISLTMQSNISLQVVQAYSMGGVTWRLVRTEDYVSTLSNPHLLCSWNTKLECRNKDWKHSFFKLEARLIIGFREQYRILVKLKISSQTHKKVSVQRLAYWPRESQWYNSLLSLLQK